VFRQSFHLGTIFSRVHVHLALAVCLMFVSAASCVESATSLPAGTVIYLRLTTPVSSKTSKNNDAIKATVARDVTTSAGVVIPVGAVVSGRIEKLVKGSTPDERDQLQLSFTGLELPDKSSVKLEGHVSAVENGREKIEAGTIQGVLESEIPLTQVNRGLGKLAESNPNLGELAKIAQKNLGTVDTSIALPAGTDLLFALDNPLAVNRVFPPVVPGTLPAGLTTAVETVLANAPQRASSKDGKPGDPLNLVVIGSAGQIMQAFQQAGWSAAEKKTSTSVFDTVRAVMDGQGYGKAPVSELYVFGRAEDLAFEKMFNTFNKRHHLRLWQTGARTPDGREIWLGAATHDIGLEPTNTGSISHAIDPNLDDERSRVGADLAVGGSVAAEKLVPRSNPLSQGLTATGGKWHTDGLLLVIVLR
jgi:LssY C-terminus